MNGRKRWSRWRRLLAERRVRAAMQLALRDEVIRRGFEVLADRFGISQRAAAEVLAAMFCLSEERVLAIRYRKGEPKPP